MQLIKKIHVSPDGGITGGSDDLVDISVPGTR
jgi:hypothetical protein